jgi:hypothetical protein
MTDVPEELRLAARKVFCTDQGAHAFLTAPCPALGGAVPARMVAEGRGAEVLAFLEKLAEVAPPPSSGLGNLFRGWLGPFAGKR